MTHLGVCMSIASHEWGLSVVGFDRNVERVAAVDRADFDAAEPGVVEFLRAASDRYAVTDDLSLAAMADLVLIAPATANILAKLAAGISDDALSAICLATRAPILHAPAMNGKMWSHPATVRNVATLTDWGHQFIGPEAGLLACGYEGLGRLWPVEGIVGRVMELLKSNA